MVANDKRVIFKGLHCTFQCVQVPRVNNINLLCYICSVKFRQSAEPGSPVRLPVELHE